MPTQVKVKERGMLFSAPLVRAILEGRKTQTRRPVKPQPTHELQEDSTPACWHWEWEWKGKWLHPMFCPYGKPGDRLWVRETWAEMDNGDYIYRANYVAGAGSMKWTPSIHMPRAASRITLEVMGVRVERFSEAVKTPASASPGRPSAGPSPRRVPTGHHGLFFP